MLEGERADDRLNIVKRTYRHLAKTVHPDLYSGKPDLKDVAEKAFKKLTAFFEEAEKRIEKGFYGTDVEPVKIRTKNREYTIWEKIADGDICNLYRCEYTDAGDKKEAIFKVAREPTDNDLVSNEARVLKKLREDDKLEKWRAYAPELIESFSFKDDGSSIRRAANIISTPSGLYTLEEVKAGHPNLDPRDMAWMWGRLLIALGFTHQQGVIHGAVLPPHILIHPEQHGLVLIDWCYAVIDPKDSDEKIRAIVNRYENFYPEEVFQKEEPTCGLDIFMAARSFIYLLGGTPHRGLLPDSVPKSLRAFFNGCQLKSPGMRPQNAWALRNEFNDVIERLWGPRKFRPFSM